jgi:CubicO group peptidase (beta-lactamase class C family)
MNKTIKYLKFLLLVFVLIIFSTCTKNPVSLPEVDNQKLNDAFDQAASFSELKSLVVSRNGVIIKEQYFRSGGANVPSDVRSVTKSVTSLLIGIAIDRGFLTSVDQTIGEFLRALGDSLSTEKAAITIRDLLTMSSGFAWNELGNVNEYNYWFYSAPNQVQYLINRSLVAQPGQLFDYNSAALHLLSVILTRATNMKTQDFAQKYLFDSLGSKINSWETDRQGYTNGAAGINITPHDMIKIGQLILNDGTYNSKRIVSPEWIEQTIMFHITTNNAQAFGPGYGYCWWYGQNIQGNYVFANGFGGQFIVVVPRLNLVVAATNNWSGLISSVTDNDWYETVSLIMDNIIPAFH